jgi:hypothetical protein
MENKQIRITKIKKLRKEEGLSKECGDVKN